jgi:hypothetical protein
LTIIELVLHLHVCADPSPAEPATAGADYAADSATEPLHSIADYATDSVVVGAAPTETS